MPEPGPAPVAEAPAPAEKSGPNFKLIAIIAGVAAVVLLVVVLAMVSGGSGGTGTGGAEQPKGTETVDTTDPVEAFAGTWWLKSGDMEGLEAETLEMLADENLYVTLELDEDGTGSLDYFIGEYDITWQASSAEAGTAVVEGESMDMRRAGDNLVLCSGESGEMVFVAASETDASGDEDAIVTDGGDIIITDGNDTIITDGGGTTSTDDKSTQTIGNAEVGHLTIPSTWEDKGAGIDPNIVDAYGAVYYADPDSAYSSVTQDGEAYSRAVQLTVQPTSYTEIAQMIYDSYVDEPDTFGEVTTSELQVAGRDAILLTTSLPKDDNLQMATFVIDRDGDGKVAVAIAMNCGYSESDVEAVLTLIGTWTAE